MNAFLVALLILSLPYQNFDIGICKLSTEEDFNLASQVGFEWTRSGVAWAAIQINLWGYDFYWKEADEMVNSSIRHNITLLWTLAFTPWWCSSKENASYEDDDYYTYPPNNISEWYDFVKIIAERYKGKITAWEIWNEEDTGYFWKGSVEQFVELMRYAYMALKEVDENNTVVMGGLALDDPGVGGYNPHFLEEFLELGGGKYVDVYAFHVYGNTLSQRYSYMEETLKKYNESKSLWVTEFGASTYRGGYSQFGQAMYIISGLIKMKNMGIEKVMIYELRDSGTNVSNWDDNLGIFRADYTPKLAVYFIFIYLRLFYFGM